jgi:GT2 family glycosyltransferase
MLSPSSDKRMQHHLPKVYIILVNYNGWADTIECLESLLKLTYTQKQIIVVDNNSPNGSMQKMLDWAQQHYQHNPAGYTMMESGHIAHTTACDAEIIFIHSEKNAGFAAGNNLAIRLALHRKDFGYLWLLNNDTTVEGNSLSVLVDSAEADKAVGKRTGIWGSKLLFYHSPDTIQALGGSFNQYTFTTSHLGENVQDGNQPTERDLKPDYVIGASMFVSKEFIEDVGLLSEDYFLYFEELDWAKRGQLEGYSLGYVGASRVYHKEGQTIGSSTDGSKKSALADYHGIRSKIIFVRKFYPGKLPNLYLLLTGSILLRLKRLQFKRALKIVSLMINTTD